MFPDADEPGMSVPSGFTNLHCEGPLTVEDLEQLFGRCFRQLRDQPVPPPKIDYYHPEQAARLRDFELYRNIPVTFPLHEESEVERIRRSLAFHAFIMPAPLPAHLWLLTDPPYEATDPARRCLRVKRKPSPDVLRKELRRRKRRRNHA